MEERRKRLHPGYLIAIIIPIIVVILLVVFWPSNDGGGKVTPTPTSTGTATATPTSTATATSTPAAEVTVSINVSETIDKSTEKDFHVYIDITDVDNFAGAQYDITYDSDVLRIIDISDGEIDGTAIPIEDWQFIPSMKQGTVRIINILSDASGADGDGYIADILFRVIGFPGDSCTISFTTASGDTESYLRLGNADAEEIPASWIDAAITIE